MGMSMIKRITKFALLLMILIQAACSMQASVSQLGGPNLQNNGGAGDAASALQTNLGLRTGISYLPALAVMTNVPNWKTSTTIMAAVATDEASLSSTGDIAGFSSTLSLAEIDLAATMCGVRYGMEAAGTASAPFLFATGGANLTAFPTTTTNFSTTVLAAVATAQLQQLGTSAPWDQTDVSTLVGVMTSIYTSLPASSTSTTTPSKKNAAGVKSVLMSICPVVFSSLAAVSM
jgi:hypothetical protein